MPLFMIKKSEVVAFGPAAVNEFEKHGRAVKINDEGRVDDFKGTEDGYVVEPRAIDSVKGLRDYLKDHGRLCFYKDIMGMAQPYQNPDSLMKYEVD